MNCLGLLCVEAYEMSRNMNNTMFSFCFYRYGMRARQILFVFTGLYVLSHSPDLLSSESKHDDVNSLILEAIPDAQMLGSVRYKYMFWELYDASLYSAQQPFSIEQPFSLKLDYLRNLKGEKIAERSIEEMRKLGFKDERQLDKWSQALHGMFPDVQKGDFIVGIKNQSGETIFYKNHQKLGEIDDPVFSRIFFSIWLGEHERARVFKKDLLQP